MDRKMFDMSDFYRMSDTMRTDPVREERACRRTGSGGSDCDDPLTMVFINMQPLDSVYPLCEAYCNGTLFPNLNKPFVGGMQR